VAPAAPPYHVGLVVDDLEAAQRDLSEVLHLTWAKVQRRTSTMDTPAGLVTVDVAFVYTLEGPPYLELIERRDGSIFDQVGLHHIGMWSEDGAAESDRLGDLGWPREAVGVRPDGTRGGGCFHVADCGLRVEVVDIGRSGPALLRYLAGGDYRIGP
jgi:hypothetical protein